MDRAADHRGAVPERQKQQSGAVQGSEDRGDSVPAAAEQRRYRRSLSEGAGVGRRDPGSRQALIGKISGSVADSQGHQRALKPQDGEAAAGFNRRDRLALWTARPFPQARGWDLIHPEGGGFPARRRQTWAEALSGEGPDQPARMFDWHHEALSSYLG